EHQAHLDDKESYVIPEGESLQQFFARAVACLEDLSVSHDGQQIAVVTHGGVIDAWFRFVLDIPLHAPRKAKLWNVGLNSIAREDDGEWRLHTWGERSHIQFIDALDDI
nr:histidine phosphatase family protein [Pyrinomonadaceae bacterium]